MTRRRPTIEPFGDRALLVVLGGGIARATNARVHALAAAIRAEAARGVAWGHPGPHVRIGPGAVRPGRAGRGRGRGPPGRARRRARVGGARRPGRAAGRRDPDPLRRAGRAGPRRCRRPARPLARRGRRPPCRAGRTTCTCSASRPGFAYLGILPRSLEVARRDVPRTHVPAGSVAIAGRQTGVYPDRLAGRLEPHRPHGGRPVGPAGRPADAPRRRAGASASCPSPADARGPRAGPRSRRSRTAGARASPTSACPSAAPADPWSLAVANVLLGNDPADAVLEVTIAGPELRVLRRCVVALAGADLGAHVVEEARADRARHRPSRPPGDADRVRRAARAGRAPILRSPAASTSRPSSARAGRRSSVASAASTDGRCDAATGSCRDDRTTSRPPVGRGRASIPLRPADRRRSACSRHRRPSPGRSAGAYRGAARGSVAGRPGVGSPGPPSRGAGAAGRRRTAGLLPSRGVIAGAVQVPAGGSADRAARGRPDRRRLPGRRGRPGGRPADPRPAPSRGELPVRADDARRGAAPPGAPGRPTLVEAARLLAASEDWHALAEGMA